MLGRASPVAGNDSQVAANRLQVADACRLVPGEKYLAIQQRLMACSTSYFRPVVTVISLASSSFTPRSIYHNERVRV